MLLIPCAYVIDGEVVVCLSLLDPPADADGCALGLGIEYIWVTLTFTHPAGEGPGQPHTDCIFLYPVEDREVYEVRLNKTIAV